MSTTHLDDALARSRSRGTARLVLAVLAFWADKETSESWLSIGRLTELCNCSERWVRYAITELEELGEITVVRRPRNGNLYTIRDFTHYDSVQDMYPEGAGDIKSPERQQSIIERRSRVRREPVRRKPRKGVKP